MLKIGGTNMNAYVVQLRKNGKVVRQYSSVFDYALADELIQRRKLYNISDKTVSILEIPVYDDAKLCVKDSANKELNLPREREVNEYVYGSDEYIEKLKIAKPILQYYKAIINDSSRLEELYKVNVYNRENKLIRSYGLVKDEKVANEVVELSRYPKNTYTYEIKRLPMAFSVKGCILETSTSLMESLGVHEDFIK